MKKVVLAGLASTLLSTTAFAAPFTDNVNNDVYSGIVNGIPTANDNNDGVPDLHDAVNNVLGTNYTRNSDLDNRFIADDSLFVGNGSHSIALIGLTAGNSNTLGIYQGDTETDVLPYDSHFGFTGNGSASNPYAGATFDVTGEFGWYLQANGPYSYNQFYSEADKNDGGWDHMMTFSMEELNGQTRYLEIDGETVEYTFANAFLIGWEDLPYGYEHDGMLGDDDYDDMMYLVDFRPITEVPEPMTAFLLGAGLLGLVGVRRKSRK